MALAPSGGGCEYRQIKTKMALTNFESKIF
jgi:hypothetical protein